MAEMTPAEARHVVAEALRSGAYEQGTERLCSVGNGKPKYCCLGVACEEYIKYGGVLSVEETSVARLYDGYAGVLPPAVVDWLGFIDEWGTFLGDPADGPLSLAGLNDDRRLGFPEIADYFDNPREGMCK